MEKISITRALKELTLLDKRIESKINELETYIEEFEADIDIVLSESNASTMN